MASIAGYHHLSLTVADVGKSAAWYKEVLGFSIEEEFEREGFRRARLRQPDSGVTLSLTQHDNGTGQSFSELRTGMDHVAFEVRSVNDVEDFKRKFEELGVVHSDIKPTRARFSGGAMITVRDPDNIQLEMFAPGAPREGEAQSG